MSAGEFVRTKYAASSVAVDGTATIHPIRVQPETLEAAIGGVTNAAPAGALTHAISARVSGSRATLGLNAAKVALKWLTAPPAGYLERGVVTIPCLSPEFKAACVPSAQGTYLGQGVQVVFFTPESVK